jgi:hypothetical protein
LYPPSQTINLQSPLLVRFLFGEGVNLYTSSIERWKESVVAEKYEEIGERHLELLGVVADLARNDPAAVAQMYRAAQRMNLNTVGKQADRVEFLALVRDLEGAGCVVVKGGGLGASYGMLCVTKEGHRQLEAT